MKIIIDLNGSSTQELWSREELAGTMGLFVEELVDDNGGFCWLQHVMRCGCIVAEAMTGDDEKTVEFSQHQDCKIKHDRFNLALSWAAITPYDEILVGISPEEKHELWLNDMATYLLRYYELKTNDAARREVIFRVVDIMNGLQREQNSSFEPIKRAVIGAGFGSFYEASCSVEEALNKVLPFGPKEVK